MVDGELQKKGGIVTTPLYRIKRFALKQPQKAEIRQMLQLQSHNPANNVRIYIHHALTFLFPLVVVLVKLGVKARLFLGLEVNVD